MKCNFDELLIYDMNSTKKLDEVFKKYILSYYFIKIVNLTCYSNSISKKIII